MSYTDNRTERNSRAVNIRTAWMILIAVIVTACFLIFLTGRQTKADNFEQTAQQADKYYTSYTVQSGDTLWTIAAQYRQDCDTGAYVDEVCRINHLDSPDRIYAGRNLCIPYYGSRNG